MRFILFFALLMTVTGHAAEICFTPNTNTLEGISNTLTKFVASTRDNSKKSCKTQNGVIVPDGMSFVDCVEPESTGCYPEMGKCVDGKLVEDLGSILKPHRSRIVPSKETLKDRDFKNLPTKTQ